MLSQQDSGPAPERRYRQVRTEDVRQIARHTVGIPRGPLLQERQFVAASIVAGLGVLPAGWTDRLTDLSSWLVAAVLAAIGTSLAWRRLRAAGPRPLLFGGILAVTLAASALVLQYATGWR